MVEVCQQRDAAILDAMNCLAWRIASGSGNDFARPAAIAADKVQPVP